MDNTISKSHEKKNINWLWFHINKIHNRNDRKEIILLWWNDIIYSFEIFLYSWDTSKTARVNWEYWHFSCDTEDALIQNILEELSIYINHFESPEVSLTQESIETSNKIWDILDPSHLWIIPQNIDWLKFYITENGQHNKLSLSVVGKKWAVYNFVLSLSTIQQKWWRTKHIITTLSDKITWESSSKKGAIQDIFRKISEQISIFESARFIKDSIIKDDKERVANTKEAYTHDEGLFYTLRPRDIGIKSSKILEDKEMKKDRVGLETEREAWEIWSEGSMSEGLHHYVVEAWETKKLGTIKLQNNQRNNTMMINFFNGDSKESIILYTFNRHALQNQHIQSKGKDNIFASISDILIKHIELFFKWEIEINEMQSNIAKDILDILPEKREGTLWTARFELNRVGDHDNFGLEIMTLKGTYSIPSIRLLRWPKSFSTHIPTEDKQIKKRFSFSDKSDRGCVEKLVRKITSDLENDSVKGMFWRSKDFLNWFLVERQSNEIITHITNSPNHELNREIYVKYDF